MLSQNINKKEKMTGPSSYMSSAHSQLLRINTRIFLFTSTSNSNCKLPDFMCADTTVQEEEEEDPSDGKSLYYLT